jgi:hypothetical protein
VVTIRRTRAGGSRRVLRAISWFDSTPETLVIEREEDGSYRAFPKARAKRKHEPKPRSASVRSFSLALLSTAARRPTIWRRGFPRSKAVLKKRLAELLAAEQIRHEGVGVKGDPHRWYVASPTNPAAPSAMTRNESGPGVTDS